jgi:hypothetical protein
VKAATLFSSCTMSQLSASINYYIRSNCCIFTFCFFVLRFQFSITRRTLVNCEQSLQVNPSKLPRSKYHVANHPQTMPRIQSLASYVSAGILQ